MAYSHFASVLFLPRWVSSWVPDPADAAFRRLQISWQLPTSLQIRKSLQDRLGLVETQVTSISHGHDLIEIAIRGSILWTTLVTSLFGNADVLSTASSGVCRCKYPKASVAPAGIVLSVKKITPREKKKGSPSTTTSLDANLIKI